MNILFLYFLLIPIIIYLIFTTSITVYSEQWVYKLILVYSGLVCAIISLIFNNGVNDKYVFPILLFLNILILCYVSLFHEIKYINIISLIGILYLLVTFNYKDFELKNGILINPNKFWIYVHIIILCFYYLISDFIKLKFSFIILVLYPLIFPLNEYFIHRLFSLSLSAAIYWKYKSLF